MSDLQFEWDDEKQEINLEKHGVDFLDVVVLFEQDCPEWASDYPFEERYLLIGPLFGRLITVVYTWRDDTIRIISAREASRDERKKYHESHLG